MIDRIKVRLFVGILFSCFLSELNAQKSLINTADSLFDQQKYTEALNLYDQIYNEGQASQAMLLKMAFIQDGLGDYAEALYYLDKYYQLSADRNVVGKIEQLAEANDLKGYSYNDTHYFLAMLDKYENQFLLLLVAVVGFLLVYILKKRKAGEKPFAAGVIQIMLIALILVLNNFDVTSRGIIVANETLLRSGPSAGAEPIEIIAKGHKVRVLEHNEVWTKIVWEGQEVYVRNGKLRVI
jgi:tetratricopeptide (TPR) repeat protein